MHQHQQHTQCLHTHFFPSRFPTANCVNMKNKLYSPNQESWEIIFFDLILNKKSIELRSWFQISTFYFSVHNHLLASTTYLLETKEPHYFHDIGCIQEVGEVTSLVCGVTCWSLEFGVLEVLIFAIWAFCNQGTEVIINGLRASDVKTPLW